MDRLQHIREKLQLAQHVRLNEGSHPPGGAAGFVQSFSGCAQLEAPTQSSEFELSRKHFRQRFNKESLVHVLLVEDDEDDLFIAQEYFRRLARSDSTGKRFTLHHVWYLTEALSALTESSEPVDVVLLDLSLPDSEGLETFFRLKAAAKDTPTVILTGQSDALVAAEAVYFGADDYLVKGELDSPLLSKTLLYAIERKRREVERRKYEDQVRHVEKLKSLGLFAGGIAHDFNNSLAAVRGNIQLAMRRIPASAPGYDLLQNAEHAGKLASDLMDQILSYAGKGSFKRETVFITDVVEDVAKLLSIIVKKNVQVDLQLDSELPPVHASRSQLHQAVLNLVVNGSDAIQSPPGRVKVATGTVPRTELTHSLARASDCATYVYIQVTDTGCGFDEELKEKLFDPFFTTKTSGRGLGLAAVWGIVESHGGYIEVESEVGTGSEFCIYLPAAEYVEPQPAEESSEEPALQDSPSEKGVLVIDDDPLVRGVLSNILKYDGYSVLEAESGTEGISLFQSHRDHIACVIIDMTLPDMQGGDALRRIKELRISTPAILISGFTEQNFSELIEETGRAAFLRKPFDHEVLLTTINELLSSQSDNGAPEQTR